MTFYCQKAIALFCVLNTIAASSGAQVVSDTLHYTDEKHFKNIQQLTFGGDNAEAYWSYDGKQIIFQRTNAKEGVLCDQMFTGALPAMGEKFTYKMVSSGKGRTTCGYFLPDGKHVVYASTHKGADTCPPPPDRAKFGNRYIWPVYESYDIFLATTDGKIVKQLTTEPGYDAEATLSPDGKTMLFTSIRNGDLDLYTMDLETYKVKQLTTELGYDGGAWFSSDGKKIVWRASRPKTGEEIKEYKELLAQGMVAPTKMEVFVANADGTGVKQVTQLGQANWAPNFTPDSKRIIFCSNHEYKRGFPFNMYLINFDGSGLEKISRDKGFDAFPMFSPDGKKIIFASNRNNGGTRDTNLFVADWVE
ncbi:PD40 domain-containing protein [Panacibacter sp. DH6]|uniref:PD40 domain-containing protein n=1 Tax=Panacibacter microcysteis TaxID=2793269 RepID=A0A931EA74_9BACT|nr:PD40 domain-containing protein [Panacibacter microcysteis]MBG9376561.1 PD40 domain-containing protein [Panacibacter microcysteis]